MNYKMTKKSASSSFRSQHHHSQSFFTLSVTPDFKLHIQIVLNLPANMGSKRITITLTQEQVIDFNTNKRKLCFATGMGDKPAYNVIAWSDSRFPDLYLTEMISLTRF